MSIQMQAASQGRSAGPATSTPSPGDAPDSDRGGGGLHTEDPVQAVFGFSSPAALLNYSHNFNSDEPGPVLNPLPTCPKVSDDVHSALGRIDVHSALGQESWRSFNRPESGHGS